MFAELDKIPPGLKLASQHNVILYDSTWFQEWITTTTTTTTKNHNNNKTKNKENYPYDDDEDEDDYDYDYEEDTDLQESDMDEIDPNELGDLLQDTCNKIPTQEQVQES